MAKRTSNSSVNSSIRQQTKSNEEGLTQLLAAQQASLGELTSIKQLLELSKDVKRSETSAAAAPDTDRLMEKMFTVAKEQLKGSRRYWKLQEDFQKEWDEEAKNIAEMAKGMKTFKTMGEKWADKKEGMKEKFGISNGGLKKTVLGALNVGGIFNKTLERDKFVEQQKALGSTASTKELRKDYEGAYAASKATKKTEAAIAKHKATAGVEDEEHLKKVSPEFAKLIEQRQSNADEYAKYQRATDIYSPTPVNRNINPLAAVKDMASPKTPTATAAEQSQSQEVAQESQKVQETEVNYLKVIAENTGGAHKNAGDKKPEPVKAEGGGILDTIMSFLSNRLMAAFKAIMNPGAILKALGRVFAIGMIVGALFEGVMDGFDEFMKTGDIGKALIAGLAGIIDFLTFGLFDKEKIKAVIGDFSSWIGDHIVKPFTEFISGVKDSFMSLIENIGIPEVKFKIPVINKEVGIGPFYPFKKEGGSTETKQPEAVTPSTANQVEQKSAENAGAKEGSSVSNKTNVVNAPVTNNSNTTQIIRSPIRNQESSQSRYLNNRYA